MIPLCVPHMGGNEAKYLQECVETNFVSSVGPFVDRFEEVLAEYVGARSAVATVTGTAALHIALLVAGVELDDEVLVSTLSFIAPANAVRYVGAWPVFVDAEPKHWQMDPERVEHFLRTRCLRRGMELFNRDTGRRVRAIIPVHILGHPVQMQPILNLAREFDLTVIEDATEGLGATYEGRPLGALSHIGCFSFNGNKLITTGGGGMIVTDNEDWADQARYLTTQAKDDPVEYVHHSIGYNYRLTNVQAALGCAQMEMLSDHIARKRQIAERYVEVLSDIAGLTPMSEAAWARSAFWLYTVRVDALRYGRDSRALLQDLGRACVQARPLWQPLHLSPAHAGAVRVGGEVAERLHHEALSLPSSVGLTDEEQSRVVQLLRCHGRG